MAFAAGATMSAMLPAVIGAGIGAQTAGAYSQAKGQKAAAEYESSVARNNAEYSKDQAQDAIRRGNQAQNEVRLTTAQRKSQQRAALASRGVDIGEGSALNILADTDYFGEIDAQTTKYNSELEAYGFKRQGENFRRQSEWKKNVAGSISPGSSALSTLLTSASQAAPGFSALSTPQILTQTTSLGSGLRPNASGAGFKSTGNLGFRP